MTSILPTVLPALPSAPIVASFATIDASVVLLPLALVVSITVGILVERARVARGDRRTRRTLHLVPMGRAA